MAVLAIGLAAAWMAPAGYAALAYTVASTAAQMLFAKTTKVNVDGAKLSDLKVSTSAYGNPIPITYGTTRIAGNQIWTTDLIQSSYVTRESSGGKMGGGGTEVSTTNYTYSVSNAFLLCEGIIRGVKRIWAEGEMIMDLDTANDGYVGDLQAKIKVYKGTEEQLPDPTIESIEGVGNVEAYRGWAYIVFTSIQLAKFGNRVPSLTFEVIKGDGTTVITKTNLTEVDMGSTNWYSAGQKGGFYNPANRSIVYVSTDYHGIAKYNPYTNTLEAQNYDPTCTFTVGQNPQISFTYDGNILVGGQSGGVDCNFLIDGDTLQIIKKNFRADYEKRGPMVGGFLRGSQKFLFNNTPAEYLGLYSNVFYADQSPVQIVTHGYDGISYSYQNIYLKKKVNMNFSNGFYYYRELSFNNNTNWDIDQQKQHLYFCSYQSYQSSPAFGGDPRRYMGLSRIDLQTYQTEEEFVDLFADLTVGGTLFVNYLFFDQTARAVVVLYTINTGMFCMKFNVDSNTVVFNNRVSGSAPIMDQDGVMQNLLQVNSYTHSLARRKVFLQYNNNSSTGFWPTMYFDLDTGLFESFEVDFDTNPEPNSEYNLAYVEDLSCLISFGYQKNNGAQILKNIGVRYQNLGSNLADIVIDLATRSGLSSSEIDVSDLVDDDVRGFTVASTTPIRSVLEQLAQAFNFNIVETDWKMKFPKNGKAPIRTIDVSELSANSYSPDMKFDQDINTTRIQELELPQLCNFTYLDVSKDYQQNTQSATRETVFSNEITPIEMPIVMTPDEAKRIVDRMMYSMWIQRDSYTFQTNMDYVELEPCDVIQVTKDSSIFTMMITKKEQDSGIMKFSCVCEDASVFSQYSNGSVTSDQGQKISSVSTTKTSFLDIPIMQNSDNDPGYYIGANKQSPTQKWTGSSLFISNDATNYSVVTDFSNNATTGSSKTVLGNFTGGNVFDSINELEVILVNGELSSVTYEQVLNGGNVALVGNEIIQFMTATLIGPKTYKLTQLLRGRWNTDDQINVHNQGDRFVFLNTTGIKRVKSDVSIINLPKFYKNATFGKMLNDTAMMTFTNTAKGLQCYPVDDVQSNRTPNGDVYLNWKPRVRGNALLQDNMDVYDSDGDFYEIDIYNSGNTAVIRTIVIDNAKSYIYTTAMQTADFGSNQATVNMMIYKKNAMVGRGRAKYKLA